MLWVKVKHLWGARAALTSALVLAGCGESVRHVPADEASAGGSGATRQLQLLDSYGLPFADMQVLVDDTVVTTDENGLATLPEVGERYDVSVVSSGRAYVFVGLTARAPVVRLFGSTNGDDISSLSLTVAWPELRSDQDFFWSAGFDGVPPEQQFFGTSRDDAALSLYGYWAGTSPVTFSAEVFVVDVDPDTRAPLGFTGYATESWKIEPDTDLSWAPSPAQPPFDTATIHVNVDLPEGAKVYSHTTSMFEPSGREGSFGTLFDPVSTDILVPDVPDTAYTVEVATSADDLNGFTAKAENVHAGEQLTLKAHAAPLPFTPEQGGVVSPATDFTWTADDGAVYELAVSIPNGDGTNRLTVVTTSEPSARLPDLTQLGSPFPVGRAFSWQVYALEGVASLDSFATDGHFGSSGLTGIRQATGSE